MNGFIIIISGFSGAGKGTLMKRLLEKYPGEYALSVSATTRKPRAGEKHGIDYFFLSKSNFEDMIQNDQLLEYAQYVDNYYGTPKRYVDEQLMLGKNVLLEIEIQGGDKVKKANPDAKRIFVSTRDAATLYGRLKGRQTESEEVIRQRMSRAIEEVDGVETYDYLVINDTVDECCDLIHTIIKNEREGKSELNASNTVASQIDFINTIREKLIRFSKGELL